MIGEEVCRQINSRSEKLYRNIFRLPPGHTLSIDHSGLRIRRYWKLHDGVENLRSDDDYIEKFLEIFSEAVRCRIADQCRVGFDLSGGIDSSSVVCMATRI